jgi:Na+-transporting NADH:ubiquinone oxidoreductase subunit A
MDTIRITKGLDLKLTGKPSNEVEAIPRSNTISLFPAAELSGKKIKLLVKAGDEIKRGTPLLFDKAYDGFKLRSPAAGKVSEIVLGARRSIAEIKIELHGNAADPMYTHNQESILKLKQSDMLAHLCDSGLLALVQERPFSKLANPANTPKSIFVNAMSTAPFQVHALTALNGRDDDFQLGLNALTRLTDGEVFLCISAEDASGQNALTNAQNVRTQAFSGPHPAGNTSTHIHHLDPIAPGDTVWTVRAEEVVLIGELFRTGLIPDTKTIVLAGPKVKEESRKHYQAQIGVSLESFLGERVLEGDGRLVHGNLFNGTKAGLNTHVRTTTSSICILAEDADRHFMGWMAPGINKFSTFRAYLSGWFGQKREWEFGTNKNGSPRALVLTGIYDKYVPLNIMVDYLIRSCIAHDTDEAIKLGILETDPEDFALCSFICPSKTDFSSMVRRTLNEIEAEGL